MAVRLRPFQCGACGKRFAMKERLREHFSEFHAPPRKERRTKGYELRGKNHPTKTKKSVWMVQGGRGDGNKGG